MHWYIILIIVLAVLLLICFVVGFLVWNMAIPTKRPETYRNTPTDDPVEIQMRDFEEKVERSLRYMNLEDCWIKSHDGLNLHAYYRSGGKGQLHVAGSSYTVNGGEEQTGNETA